MRSALATTGREIVRRAPDSVGDSDGSDVVYCRSHRQRHEIRWFDRVPGWLWFVAATDAAWTLGEMVMLVTGR